MKTNWIYIILLISFTSCFREDEPVPPYTSPDGVHTAVAELGALYSVQVFYDLKSNSFVRSVPRESWDLAFQCGASGYHVFLNGSKLMKVGLSGTTDFNAVTGTNNLTWRYDRSEGWQDSTAIGEWGTGDGENISSFNFVYVIDRGLSTLGNNLGFKKLVIEGLTDGMYTIRFANLDGSEEHSLSFEKDDAYNYIFVSLNGEGSVKEVEPPKSTWDLQFTQYTTLVEQSGTGIVEQYSVNGALLNSYMVTGAREFNKPFTEIAYTDLATYNFTSQKDIIGYDWKTYDFNAATYLIDANKVYLVKDVEGNFYKLRFTSFTNSEGQKGYPTFEVAEF